MHKHLSTCRIFVFSYTHKSYKLQSYFEFKFTFSLFIGRGKAEAKNIKTNFMFLAYKLYPHTDYTAISDECTAADRKLSCCARIAECERW